MLKPEDFFDLEGYEFRDVFAGCKHVWGALQNVGRVALQYIMDYQDEKSIAGTVMKGAYVDDADAVIIGEGTVVEPGAFIQGPAIIGKNCQIRHGSYIRGDVIIGNDCIVGHSSELKNAIMLDKAQCPHFAYVGDSILGRNVNLGAGTKLSNVQVTSFKDPESGKRPPVIIVVDEVAFDTGLSKFGAIIGDGSQTGCNVVTNPGCLIGKNVLVYAGVSLRKGYYEDNRIIKVSQDIQTVERY